MIAGALLIVRIEWTSVQMEMSEALMDIAGEALRARRRNRPGACRQRASQRFAAMSGHRSDLTSFQYEMKSLSTSLALNPRDQLEKTSADVSNARRETRRPAASRSPGFWPPKGHRIPPGFRTRERRVLLGRPPVDNPTDRQCCKR
jgi:hypothetical protein